MSKEKDEDLEKWLKTTVARIDRRRKRPQRYDHLEVLAEIVFIQEWDREKDLPGDKIKGIFLKVGRTLIAPQKEFLRLFGVQMSDAAFRKKTRRMVEWEEAPYLDLPEQYVKRIYGMIYFDAKQPGDDDKHRKEKLESLGKFSEPKKK